MLVRPRRARALEGRTPGRGRAAAGKRALDLVGAGVGLVLLTLPMLVIALVVRLRLGAPVLFRAVRAGRGGHPFVLYKFRTMLDLRAADGTLLPDEARITRVGRLLRRSSLDELPQLVNVIRGEMSLVGPRPLLVEYLERYSEEQARRHEVLPGITGWSQIHGRNVLAWRERLALDVWYVDHASFALDLKILLRTALKVVRRADVSAEGDLSVPSFMGNEERSSG